jgi:hypothetical protein
MKTHTAIRKVLAAAKRDARKHPSPALRKQIKEAIEVVVLFRDDNHEFIGFYDDDAGLT